MSLLFRNQEKDFQIINKRVISLIVIVVLLFSVLLFQAFSLQVLSYEQYATQSKKNIIQTRSIMPQRGLIYDRNGVLLAKSSSHFTLDIVPELTPSVEETIQLIKKNILITDREVEYFHRKLSRNRTPYTPVTLKSFLDDVSLAKIAVRQHHMPGVSINAQLRREYPYGSTYAHVIGSVRRINEQDKVEKAYKDLNFIGRLGIEKFYELELRGQRGIETVEVDAFGNIHRVLNKKTPINGLNIEVTIDHQLQQKATELMSPFRGALVALDVSDGSILSLVSYPSYDPNMFIRGINQQQYDAIRFSKEKPLFNRAISGQYAPGSTIKPVIGLIGLSYELIDWEYVIKDKGFYRLPNESRIFRDWSWTREGVGGHGVVNLNKAIYRSSNVFFYELATKLNIHQVNKELSQFFLGRTSRSDILGTKPGLIPSPEWKKRKHGAQWYVGDTLNISIGQGSFLVTPLQMATIATALANKGVWHEPFLMKSIKNWDGELVKSSAVKSYQVNLGTDIDWQKMKESMRDVVHRHGKTVGQNGTAWAYIGQNINYQMAGKSGTSQVVEITQDEEYDASKLDEFHRKHAWFIAFAPFDNPKIAIAVLIENGGGGSSVAAPVVRKLLDFYLKKLS